MTKEQATFSADGSLDGPTITVGGSGALREPLPDTLGLPERYEDLGPIGEGGMGEVRQVRDTRLGSTLALKISSDLPSATWQRLVTEAMVTAQLDHPGIVSVQDLGRLPDGRPWFTMDLVRGRTLTAVLRAVHAASGTGWGRTDDGWSLRRLVAVCVSASQAVAYAHARGVIHRDLKPDNIMVGDLGEVRVMDWGLARLAGQPEVVGDEVDIDSGHTQAGRVVGTPAFMPVEQARGDLDALDARTDVYSLGAVLYTVLAGRAPFTGRSTEVWAAVRAGPPPRVTVHGGPAIPPGLVAIVERAMARAQADRYPSAAELARALQRWLDGAEREAEARAIVAQASAMRPRIATLRADAAARDAEAAALKDGEGPTAEDCVPRWRLEDEAIRLRREARVAEADMIRTLRSALERAPDLVEAHDLLGAHYRARLLAAEARDDADAAAEAEAMLRSHDRGRFTSWLKGDGAVTVHSDPPGAVVRAFRYVEVDRRLVPEPAGVIGTTPLDAHPLPRGSWLLVLEKAGHDPLRVPVAIGRLEHWDGVRPGASAPHPLRLHRDPGPGVCAVAAGWFLAGGDPKAADAWPARRLWVDGFLVQTHPVTHRQYLAFLDARSAEGVEVADWVPRTSSGERLYRRDDGRFAIEPSIMPQVSDPDAPVVLVTHAAARAYAAWWSSRTGRTWRLPHDLEREKASRGVDGRSYPWGRHFHPQWARSGQGVERPCTSPVHDHPQDESPYGVRGTAGNVRDWCANPYAPTAPADGTVVHLAPAPAAVEWWMVRGGAWTGFEDWCRTGGRLVGPPDATSEVIGFRLVSSV